MLVYSTMKNMIDPIWNFEWAIVEQTTKLKCSTIYEQSVNIIDVGDYTYIACRQNGNSTVGLSKLKSIVRWRLTYCTITIQFVWECRSINNLQPRIKRNISSMYKRSFTKEFCLVCLFEYLNRSRNVAQVAVNIFNQMMSLDLLFSSFYFYVTCIGNKTLNYD